MYTILWVDLFNLCLMKALHVLTVPGAAGVMMHATAWYPDRAGADWPMGGFQLVGLSSTLINRVPAVCLCQLGMKCTSPMQ